MSLHGIPTLEEHDLVPGLYVYARGIPTECKGFTYRLHRAVKDVPSYQTNVLVEAIDGPDAGLWFTVSVNNFQRRYEPLNEPEAVAAPAEETAILADYW